MQVNTAILFTLIAAALWTVMTRSLIRSAIGLALTSVILTIIMFRLNSPMAAVFELSVCAGLITAVFISTIAMTKPLTHQEILTMTKGRINRYWYLPVILVITAVILSVVKFPEFQMPKEVATTSVNDVLWRLRQFDMLGQVSILLAGVFGIVVLFKEARKR